MSERTVQIPGWIILAAKLLAPVIVTCAVVYSRFSAVEHTASVNAERVIAIESKQESRAEMFNQMSQRITTVELKESLLEKSIADSLARIENAMREMRADMKDLQKSAATAALKP